MKIISILLLLLLLLILHIQGKSSQPNDEKKKLLFYSFMFMKFAFIWIYVVCRLFFFSSPYHIHRFLFMLFPVCWFSRLAHCANNSISLSNSTNLCTGGEFFFFFRLFLFQLRRHIRRCLFRHKQILPMKT